MWYCVLWKKLLFLDMCMCVRLTFFLSCFVFVCSVSFWAWHLQCDIFCFALLYIICFNHAIKMQKYREVDIDNFFNYKDLLTYLLHDRNQLLHFCCTYFGLFNPLKKLLVSINVSYLRALSIFLSSVCCVQCYMCFVQRKFLYRDIIVGM